MFRRLHDTLNGMAHKLDLIETVLMVREPGSVKAAEAYEGLRRQVVAAFGERQSHLAHLAQIDAAIQRNESPEAIGLLVGDLMRQVGVQRVDDPTDAGLYEIVDGKGDSLVVLEPAYLDESTGRVVKQGRARAESSGQAADDPSDALAEAVLR